MRILRFDRGLLRVVRGAALRADAAGFGEVTQWPHRHGRAV